MGLNQDPLELCIELTPDSTDRASLASAIVPADMPNARVITNVDEYVEGFRHLFVRTRDGRLYSFKGMDIVDLLKRWPGKKWRPVRLHRMGELPPAHNGRAGTAPSRRPR